MNLIEQLEQEEIARLGKTIPPFAPGDTVVVQVKVKEGTRERLQAGGAMRELKTTDLARLDPFRAGSQLSLGEPCVFAKGANATSELLAYLVHLDSALNPSWWNSNSHTRW